MLCDLETQLSEIDRYEHFKYDFIDINMYLTQVKKLNVNEIVRNYSETFDLFSNLKQKTK
jgi:hypothetical protein